MTRPEASLAAQDVRRGDASASEGMSFESALEAQIATAGIAQGAPTLAEDESSRLKLVKAKKIDATEQAEEKLAARPQENALGLQSAVQSEMNSPRAQAHVSDGAAVRPQSDQDSGREASSRAGVSDQRGEGTRSASGTVAAKDANRSEPSAGEKSNGQQAGDQQESPRKTADSARSPACGTANSAVTGAGTAGVAVAAVGANVAAGGDKAVSAGRTHGISAVDALGALGRKTAFKLTVAERPLTKADADRFIAQASKTLAAAVRRDGGTMVMRLTPENLGLLKVRIETKDGSVNAKVEASERSARELLTDNVESLRSALEAHGVRVEKIEIVRMDDLQGTSSFNQPGTGAMGSGSGGNSQAEDRRNLTERRDALAENHETGGLMEEPAGIYLHGVELRVDAIA